MNKYTDQDLKRMAQHVLAANSTNDPKTKFLLIILAVRTGLSQSEIMIRLQIMAAM